MSQDPQKPRHMSEDAWEQHRAESKAQHERRAKVEVDPVAHQMALEERIAQLEHVVDHAISAPPAPPAADPEPAPAKKPATKRARK
jgi:hypothetical protein